MAEAVTWSCACGQTAARIATGDGTHLVCYCTDCRAFARAVGREEWLDASGGSDLYQTTPDRIEMIRGAEHLACLRLTGRGPYRWYAACCGSPFVNTLTTRQVPFASVQVGGMDDTGALGPVALRASRESATGPVEGRTGSVAGMALTILRRAAAARLSGRHALTPFFDAKGAPVAEVRRLSPEDRARAYAPRRA